jgi:hypothetical protein
MLISNITLFVSISISGFESLNDNEKANRTVSFFDFKIYS